MHGKTKHSFKLSHYEGLTYKKSSDIKFVKIANGYTKHKKKVLKITNKPKGIEAINASLFKLPTNQVYIYSELLIPIIQNHYISLLYCVVHKRGPPF